MAAKIPVAFDVLGTCFSFDGCRDALVATFPHLAPDHGAVIIDDWFHAAQRDFTYLSMNGSYTPIAQVLRATLPRILIMHRLVPASSASSPLSPSSASSPLSPSSASSPLSPSLTEPILSCIPSLQPRPGLVAASQLLLGSGFRLMAATNGGLDVTRGLFDKALGVGEAARWEYFSCDEDKVAKPSPTVYRDVWRRLGVEDGAQEREGWFVASHTWDLMAAKKAGFKTAFVTYEEHLVLPSLFGEPNIVAADLEDAARQIIAHTGAKGAASAQ